MFPSSDSSSIPSGSGDAGGMRVAEGGLSGLPGDHDSWALAEVQPQPGGALCLNALEPPNPKSAFASQAAFLATARSPRRRSHFSP